MILALDTTHEFGSIALLARGETVEEISLHAPGGFGDVLYGQLARLLERHGCAIGEIDCFAAASGPGSFTGVRVGLACVKGLAEAGGKPVAAVSNLEALATFGRAPLRATLLDARRGEIYGALWGTDGPLQQEVVMEFPMWLDTLPDGDLEFISTDWTLFRATLAGTRFARATLTEAPRALAAAIGRIAWRRFQAGQAADPAAVDANYVRRPDAELL